MNGEILTEGEQKWLIEQHKSPEVVYFVIFLLLFILVSLFYFNPQNFLSGPGGWFMVFYLVFKQRKERSKYLKIIDKLTTKH